MLYFIINLFINVVLDLDLDSEDEDQDNEILLEEIPPEIEALAEAEDSSNELDSK